MLRCIAIDDEPLALELLVDNISKVPFLELVAECSNALEALKVLQDQKVDLVFLDIQMPGLTGLQFIQSLAEKPMFILITAYEKYALDGYTLDVLDYLVKPVSLDRFIKACNKARELHELKLKGNNSTGNSKADYFFVNVDYKLLKVVFADITNEPVVGVARIKLLNIVPLVPSLVFPATSNLADGLAMLIPTFPPF